MREALAAEYIGISALTLRVLRGKRDFPHPVQLTPGRIVWLREDLDAFLDRKAGRRVPLLEENEWMTA